METKLSRQTREADRLKFNPSARMLRSSAPSRRSRNRHDRRRREARPRIRDDFAVMPRIPESAFRPHIPLDQAGIRRTEFHVQRQEDFQVQRQEDFEYDVYNEPDVPIGDVRATTPTDGYDGEAIGMKRCSKCKSWYHPANLFNGKCRECKEPDNQANEVNCHLIEQTEQQ